MQGCNTRGTSMARSTKREENPFEDAVVAAEWIRSVEGEHRSIRDNEIYPMLRTWASDLFGTIVEIGSGQGICSQHLGTFAGNYVGIEPSEHLVSRAQELYEKDSKTTFIVGNAYRLPISDAEADNAFSVAVWFHLAKLEAASKELARILKTGGEFRIITTNPESYTTWENLFEGSSKNGKLLVGKVHTPVNPLSRNTLYQHTEKEMISALVSAGLAVESVTSLGTLSQFPDARLFICISGRKSA